MVGGQWQAVIVRWGGKAGEWQKGEKGERVGGGLGGGVEEGW